MFIGRVLPYQRICERPLQLVGTERNTSNAEWHTESESLPLRRLIEPTELSLRPRCLDILQGTGPVPENFALAGLLLGHFSKAGRVPVHYARAEPLLGHYARTALVRWHFSRAGPLPLHLPRPPKLGIASLGLQLVAH